MYLLKVANTECRVANKECTKFAYKISHKTWLANKLCNAWRKIATATTTKKAAAKSC